MVDIFYGASMTLPLVQSNNLPTSSPVFSGKRITMRKDLRKHAVGIDKKQCRNSLKNLAFEINTALIWSFEKKIKLYIYHRHISPVVRGNSCCFYARNLEIKATKSPCQILFKFPKMFIHSRKGIDKSRFFDLYSERVIHFDCNIRRNQDKAPAVFHAGYSTVKTANSPHRILIKVTKLVIFFRNHAKED